MLKRTLNFKRLANWPDKCQQLSAARSLKYLCTILMQQAYCSEIVICSVWKTGHLNFDHKIGKCRRNYPNSFTGRFSRKLPVYLWHRFLLHLNYVSILHSVFWHCWLGIRKSIRPVKKWMMRCWRGYQSGVRCRWFTNGPALLASLKSRMV